MPGDFSIVIHVPHFGNQGEAFIRFARGNPSFWCAYYSADSSFVSVAIALKEKPRRKKK